MQYNCIVFIFLKYIRNYIFYFIIIVFLCNFSVTQATNTPDSTLSVSHGDFQLLYYIPLSFPFSMPCREKETSPVSHDRETKPCSAEKNIWKVTRDTHSLPALFEFFSSQFCNTHTRKEIDIT